MLLSCIIPAHNEADCIAGTVNQLYSVLKQADIEHEILVVNDNSTDKTKEVLMELSPKIPSLIVVDNDYPNGFGLAVRKGLETFKGDAVCICMADSSENPDDIVKFFRHIHSYDCIFGSRWVEGANVVDYPIIKLLINRLANRLISLLFRIKYADITNGFKMYRDYVIKESKPFVSCNFNLTVEIPLKAINRGYSYDVLPNSWANRKTGKSKLNIMKMGLRYFLTMTYCLIEKWLLNKDCPGKKK